MNNRSVYTIVANIFIAQSLSLTGATWFLCMFLAGIWLGALFFSKD